MIKKVIILILMTLSFFYASNIYADDWNLDARVKLKSTENNADNDHLDSISNPHFVETTQLWTTGVKNFIISVARDIKNIFYAIATIFFLIISFRFFFSSNSEEAFTNFKKWIIWISLWLVLMQIAYSLAVTIFDRSVWTFVWKIVENLLIPIVNLLSMLASIFFVIIAIYAFIRIVSSNWEKENVKKWINAIIFAMIWFLLVKFASTIVMAIFGKYSINSSWIVEIERSWWLSNLAKMFLNLINWVNWLVWIVTVIMIIYAWVMIIFSEWDQEKLKKWRNSIIYAFIWILILVISYGILTFFIGPSWVNI